MIQLINKLKKNQKGFTLVELIVVLVILAILAAFTIPAMLGFVNDARAKALVSQTREIYMAYQAAITDVTNGKGVGTTEVTFSADKTNINPNVTADGTNNKIQKSAMSKLDKDVTNYSDDNPVALDKLKYKVKAKDASVTEVQLTNGDYTITLKPGTGDTPSGEATTEKGDHVGTITKDETT